MRSMHKEDLFIFYLVITLLAGHYMGDFIVEVVLFVVYYFNKIFFFIPGLDSLCDSFMSHIYVTSLKKEITVLSIVLAAFFLFKSKRFTFGG